MALIPSTREVGERREEEREGEEGRRSGRKEVEINYKCPHDSFVIDSSNVCPNAALL